MVNSPEMSRCHLSQMSNDNFEPGKSIKDTVDTHAQDMALYVLTELQCCHHEPFTVIPLLFLYVRNLKGNVNKVYSAEKHEKQRTGIRG